MPYQVDTPIDLNPRINRIYLASSQHRKTGNNHKSIWTISIDEEVDCFVLSHSSNWIEQSISYGLKPTGTTLNIVGRNKFSSELKIAKFVDGNRNNNWHGYPADYISNAQDRPSINTLKSWRESGYIQKHQIVKIRLGKVCNL